MNFRFFFIFFKIFFSVSYQCDMKIKNNVVLLCAIVYIAPAPAAPPRMAQQHPTPVNIHVINIMKYIIHFVKAIVVLLCAIVYFAVAIPTTILQQHPTANNIHVVNIM